MRINVPKNVHSICLPLGLVNAYQNNIAKLKLHAEQTTHKHERSGRSSIKMKIDLNYSDFRGKFHRKR